MPLENQAHDPERIQHYSQLGVRELFFHGGTERQSFKWLYEKDGDVTCHARTVFNYPDEIDDLSVLMSPTAFLDALGKARMGETVQVKSLSPTMDGWASLRMSPRGLAVDTDRISGAVADLGFDSLFLNSLSVIENSEPRLRNSREVVLGPAEGSLLDLTSQSPDLLQSFSPREFEVFVGAFLANAGFSRVQLSRFVKDGGYDLWAIYCEGDEEYTVVVEVKHYTSRRVGIEIVDRLNGVRDREGADRALLFTTSSFTADARKHYQAQSKRIAMVDFERLVDLLQAGSTRWAKTPSDLWTLPFSGSLAAQQGVEPDVE